MDNIETYRGMLRIDRHALDVALMTQPDVMERISREVARLTRHAESCRESRKEAEANVVRDARASGKSVADADAAMRGDPWRKKALAIELEADERLAEWKGLYEAWKARGYSIKDLVGLYSAQYFTANPSTDFGRREPAARHDYTVAVAARSRMRVG